MKCQKCKKEIASPDDLNNIRAEEVGRYIEVRADHECGQGYYTSFDVDDLTPE